MTVDVASGVVDGFGSASVSSDVDAEFEALYDFVRESRFERVGVFKYSTEEGTHSARMDNSVMRIQAEDRYHRLMTLQQGISQEIHEAMVGREIDVLVEGLGRSTDGHAVVGLVERVVEGLVEVGM